MQRCYGSSISLVTRVLCCLSNEILLIVYILEHKNLSCYLRRDNLCLCVIKTEDDLEAYLML